MPAVRNNAPMRLLWRLHPRLYRRTGGRLGGRIARMPVLLLTSRGRRSGQERTSALLHLRDGERFVVIASNAGEDRHPAWWLNLRAEPRGEVELGRHRIAVRAREVEGPEREQLWTRWLEADPSYDEYRKRTTRRIPVVVLEPDHVTGTRA